MLRTDSSLFTAITFVPIPPFALLTDEECKRVTALTQVLSGECMWLYGPHERACALQEISLSVGLTLASSVLPL